MHPTFSRIIVFLLTATHLLVLSQVGSTQNKPVESESQDIEKIVVQAFEKSAEGWSVDEVMLHDQRRHKFVDACKLAGADADETLLFETLLRVRKGGRLKIRATERERTSLEDFTIAAEISARRMADEKKVHFDQILCDPELLKVFDKLAIELSPNTDAYLLRKAALRLRKSRQLQPELVIQASDWKVNISEYTFDELTSHLPETTTRPGIYIFRDATGYLYIGQSNNLRDRLTHHLKESDRDQLRNYMLEHGGTELTIELHEFAEGSPGEKLASRRAYESELIRSRKPRLNLAP